MSDSLEGTGIPRISAGLPEILGLTDRLLALNEGIRAATLPAAGAIHEEILLHAAGVAAFIAGDARMASQKNFAVGEQP
ncbi:MAG TPA: hypothetical protein VII90_05390 [Anaerolineales bacterium]